MCTQYRVERSVALAFVQQVVIPQIRCRSCDFVVGLLFFIIPVAKATCFRASVPCDGPWILSAMRVTVPYHPLSVSLTFV